VTSHDSFDNPLRHSQVQRKQPATTSNRQGSLKDEVATWAKLAGRAVVQEAARDSVKMAFGDL